VYTSKALHRHGLSDQSFRFQILRADSNRCVPIDWPLWTTSTCSYQTPVQTTRPGRCQRVLALQQINVMAERRNTAKTEISAFTSTSTFGPSCPR